MTWDREQFERLIQRDMSFTEVIIKISQNLTNGTHMKGIHENITTGNKLLQQLRVLSRDLCVKNNLPGADTHLNKDCVKKEEYVKKKLGYKARFTVGKSVGKKKELQEHALQVMGRYQTD